MLPNGRTAVHLAARTMTDQSTSPLLKLPGELRNRIYRFALITHDHIRLPVTTRTFPEPALLATNKEIRREASSLFYSENHFMIEVRDFDSTACVIFSHKIAYVEGLKTARYRFSWLSKRPNWANLHLWLFRLHSGKFARPAQKGRQSPHVAVVLSMF